MIIVELHYNFIESVVGPAIINYLYQSGKEKEVYGISMGSIKNTKKDQIYAIESIIIDPGAQARKRSIIVSDQNKIEKAIKNLRSMGYHRRNLGDFHTHVTWPKKRSRYKNLETYIGSFMESTDPSEEVDLETIKENPKRKIELILGIDRLTNGVPWIGDFRQAPDGLSVMGSTDDFNYLYSGYRWDVVKKQAIKLRVEGLFLTGVKYNGKQKI